MFVVGTLVAKAGTGGLGELLCHRTYPPFLEIPMNAKSGNDTDFCATVNTYLGKWFRGSVADWSPAGQEDAAQETGS
jgi:hypothetical protein